MTVTEKSNKEVTVIVDGAATVLVDQQEEGLVVLVEAGARGAAQLDKETKGKKITEKEQDPKQPAKPQQPAQETQPVQETTKSTPQQETKQPKNPWNAFQHRMKGAGRSKEQILKLYYEEKGN